MDDVLTLLTLIGTNRTEQCVNLFFPLGTTKLDNMLTLIRKDLSLDYLIWIGVNDVCISCNYYYSNMVILLLYVLPSIHLNYQWPTRWQLHDLCPWNYSIHVCIVGHNFR